jgi:hypothetical protein
MNHAIKTPTKQYPNQSTLNLHTQSKEQYYNNSSDRGQGKMQLQTEVVRTASERAPQEFGSN